jgi:hypothetical protein
MIHFTRPTTCTCNTSTWHQSTAACFGGQLPSSGSHTNIETQWIMAQHAVLKYSYSETVYVIILCTCIIKKLERHHISTFLIGNRAKILSLERRSLATIEHVMLCQYSVYSKQHNLCFHILKSRSVIMISGVITVHTVSQFTEFSVLVRLPDDGCQQSKHVAVDWCHVRVYVLVCAGCWA